MDQPVPELEPRPAPETYQELAGRLDFALVRPELSDDELYDGCRLAAAYRLGAVLVRPCDVDTAVRALQGSGVAVSGACGFPHGTTTTPAKLYEARDLIRRGATEIDFVINIGKLISRQFAYLETELLQIAKAAHESGAIVKAIVETAYLAEDHKLIACKIAKRTGCDYVSTSSGFAPKGYTAADLALLRRKVEGHARVKAGHGISKLEHAIDVYTKGADRIGTIHPAEILDAWKDHLEQAAKAAEKEQTASASVIS